MGELHRDLAAPPVTAPSDAPARLDERVERLGNQAAVYLQAPAGDIAVASRLLRTSAYLGAIFSSILIGITFGSTATDAGFQLLACGLAGIGVVVLILTVLDRSIHRVAR